MFSRNMYIYIYIYSYTYVLESACALRALLILLPAACDYHQHCRLLGKLSDSAYMSLSVRISWSTTSCMQRPKQTSRQTSGKKDRPHRRRRNLKWFAWSSPSMSTPICARTASTASDDACKKVPDKNMTLQKGLQENNKTTRTWKKLFQRVRMEVWQGYMHWQECLPKKGRCHSNGHLETVTKISKNQVCYPQTGTTKRSVDQKCSRTTKNG